LPDGSESSVRGVEVANHGSGCGCAATGHTVTAAENRYETAPAHERSSDLGTAYHIFKQGGVLASLRKQANKIGHPLHAPITSDSASMAAVLRLTSRWIRSTGSEALAPKHLVRSTRLKALGTRCFVAPVQGHRLSQFLLILL
jgi:hypothetical protein